MADNVDNPFSGPVPLAWLPAQRRYTTVAIWLHWIIATLIVLQIALGWIMNEVISDHTPNQQRVENIHISLGLTILVLVAARIVVRLTHKPPPCRRPCQRGSVFCRPSSTSFFIF